MHIAILGCGQLSRMLALAGIPIGYRFSFIAEGDEDTRCVDVLGRVVRWQAGQSIDALYETLDQPDIVTVEKEQADVAVLAGLAKYCSVYPNANAFALCQDRYNEKQLLEKLDIATSAFIYNQSAREACEKLGLPLVAKSCRDGYDGKNQWVLKTDRDVAHFDANMPPGDIIIEKWIPFEKEVSQISVRSVNGDIQHYPLTENEHNNGILERSLAPALSVAPEIAATAKQNITKIMDEISYVGVMAMECFVVGQGLLVNELAPRVHNSGHWTQSGSATSQFENHIRAISGINLGRANSLAITGMVNLLGTRKPPTDLLSNNATLHWYNKTVRPGRKLGHVNFTGSDAKALKEQMLQFQQAVD